MAAEKTDPIISIVMAAYNEESSIAAAIQSIINQTFHDWELIIIDDGSHDMTSTIVHAFATKDARIILVKNEANSGLPASLNRGIALARGEYIARADADDVNMPQRLEKQYAFMQRHPDIDVLGTGAFLLDAAGQRVNTISLPKTHEQLKNLGFQKTPLIHPSIMARKRFFEQVGFYDTSYTRAEDKELWLRGLREGCRYANLQEPLIEYSTEGYIRSWNSIRAKTQSCLRIVKKYKIRYGYLQTVLSLLLALSVKFRLRKPRSLQ